MKAYPMRRKNREISPQECNSILEAAEYGILALTEADGTPYAVPLSFVFLNGKIYFHCAQEGRKIEAIRHQPQAEFCVVGRTQPIYIKDFSTLFESVMAFGELTEIDDTEEKHAALWALAQKYLPDHMDKAEPSIQHSFNRTAVYALNPQIISGKAKR